MCAYYTYTIKYVLERSHARMLTIKYIFLLCLRTYNERMINTALPHKHELLCVCAYKLRVFFVDLLTYYYYFLLHFLFDLYLLHFACLYFCMSDRWCNARQS